MRSVDLANGVLEVATRPAYQRNTASTFSSATTLLKELDIEKDTLVFFSGDNGSQDRFADKSHPRGYFSGNKDPNGTTEFRGTKGGPYEGSVRVSFAVSWPGKIELGCVSEHVGYFPDVLPTIALAAGGSSPTDIDGISERGANS